MDPMSDWSDPGSNPAADLDRVARAIRGRIGEGAAEALDAEARLCLARSQVIDEMSNGAMTATGLGEIARQWSTGEPGDRALMAVGLWSDLIASTSPIEGDDQH
jgi:hypothetical protein